MFTQKHLNFYISVEVLSAMVPTSSSEFLVTDKKIVCFFKLKS